MEYPYIQQLIDKGEYKPKFANSPFVHASDLINPETGLTYREENAQKQHNIPIGALVEHVETGIRLFVVYHGRDCDQTPLYSLNNDDDIEIKRHHGYDEDSLRVVNVAKIKRNHKKNTHR